MAHHPFSFPVIILAAGQSSRMRGRDKLLETVGGVPLLRRQAAMARRVTTGAVIVALPAPPHPRYAALAGLEVTCVPIPDAAEGMNASLRTAFAAVPATAPCAMLLLGDLPDLTDADLLRVANAADTEMGTHSGALIWRGATETGEPGHPIVFAASLFAQLTALCGDSGGREVVKAAAGRVRLVPLAGNRAREDLDTPEAWTAWRCRMRDT